MEAQAAETLRDAIVDGHLAPGSRITEQDLADRMQLSRASIRSALHQLAKEGLTSLIPYTGWTVARMSAQDVWELYTFRSSIDRLAARLVADNLDARKAAALRKAERDMARACSTGDMQRVADADFALHKTIIVQSGHGRLSGQYELIERQIRMFIRSSDALTRETGEVLAQHRPIVAAILACDADRAGTLCEEHNLSEGEKLHAHLAWIEAAETASKSSGALYVSRGVPRLRQRKKIHEE